MCGREKFGPLSRGGEREVLKFGTQNTRVTTYRQGEYQWGIGSLWDTFGSHTDNLNRSFILNNFSSSSAKKLAQLDKCKYLI